MAQAIELAAKGCYTTTPNPNVGCVIVRDGVLVGEGYHQRAGTPHAEVHALKQAADKAQGATAYVTLEPCSHHGRTPPCADALIKAGVKRVVCAGLDPNPLVAGRGLDRIRDAGIDAVSGILCDEAERLNPGFLKRMRTGLPYVTVKLASSLDGATAMTSGESQWITGPEAREDVQYGRAGCCAVVTGVGTVLADDPSMNVRLPEMSRQPDRIILDSHARTPLQAKIVSNPGNTWLIHGESAPAEKLAQLKDSGFKLVCIPLTDDRIDLAAFLKWAGDQQFNHLWLEAGAKLAGAFLEAGLADNILLYQAPMLLGSQTQPLIRTKFTRLADAVRLECVDLKVIGKDVRWQLKPIDA